MFLIDFFSYLITFLLICLLWTTMVLLPFIVLGFCLYVVIRVCDKHLNDKKKKNSIFDDKS